MEGWLVLYRLCHCVRLLRRAFGGIEGSQRIDMVLWRSGGLPGS